MTSTPAKKPFENLISHQPLQPKNLNTFSATSAFHSEWITSLSHHSINNHTALIRKTGPQNCTAKSGGSQAYQRFSVDRGIHLPSLYTSPDQEAVKSQIQLCITPHVHVLQKRLEL